MTTTASSTAAPNVGEASVREAGTQGKGQAQTATFAAVLDAVSKATKHHETRGHPDKAAEASHQARHQAAGSATQPLVALTESVVAAQVLVVQGKGASAPSGAAGTGTQALRTTPSQGPLAEATRPTVPRYVQGGPGWAAHEGAGATASPPSGPEVQKSPGQTSTQAADQVATTVDGQDQMPPHVAGNETPSVVAGGQRQPGHNASAGTASVRSLRDASRGAPRGAQPTGGQTDSAGSSGPGSSGTARELAGRTVHGTQPRSATHAPATEPADVPPLSSPRQPANGDRGHLAGDPPQASAGGVAQDRTSTHVLLSDGTAAPEKEPMPAGGQKTSQEDPSVRLAETGEGAVTPSHGALASEQAPSQHAGEARSPSPSGRAGGTGFERAPQPEGATAATPTKANGNNQLPTAIAPIAGQAGRSPGTATGQQAAARSAPNRQTTPPVAPSGSGGAPAVASLGASSQQAVPVVSHVGRQVSAAVAQHLDQLAPPARSTDGTWSLSVQLDPPELGKVGATLSLGASGLSVVLAPSTPAAQQAIQQASQQIAQDIGGSVTVFMHTGAQGGTGSGQQGHQGAGGQRHSVWPGRDEGHTGPDVLGERTQDATYMLV